MEKRKDIEFLEFLEPKEGVIYSVNVTSFMLANFKIPDLKDYTVLHTIFTDAIQFITRLKNKNLILFDNNVVNTLSTLSNEKDGVYYKNWFDTVVLWVEITEHGIDYLYEYRNNQLLLETTMSSKKANESLIETNKAVRSNNRNTFRILILTVIISAVNIGITIKNDINEGEKEQLRTSLQSQSKQLTEQQLMINQQGLIISHLIEVSKLYPKK